MDTRPTYDGMDVIDGPTPTGSVHSSERGSSTQEAVKQSTVEADACATGDVEMSESEVKRAMWTAVDKIKRARLTEGLPGARA